MSWESRRLVRFSRITLTMSVCCHWSLFRMASYRGRQSSTQTVSGFSAAMTCSTRSALSRETWAVPIRMISRLSRVIR